MQLDMKTLVGKLNPACKKALEGAAQLCVQQTNFNVEVEHVLLKLLEQPDTDAVQGLKAHGVEIADVMADLQDAIDHFRRGNSRTPSLSPQIADLLQEAWVFSSLTLGQAATRSAALLQAALDTESIRGSLVEGAPAFTGIPRDGLRDSWKSIIGASKEAMPSAVEASKADAKAARERRREAAKAAPEAPAETEGTQDKGADALDLFTVSLTDQALVGAIDPIVGRDGEIRQMIDILMRRRQNNPILTGEAGVGKTAVVEGLAQRIADGDVPEPLKEVDLRVLDLALLQAGASMKGEFEERLKSVIDAVRASPRPVVMFIDEAHTLIGAGGAAGQGDAANLLKPALARGELRTVAATTWAEYKKYIEKDPALARRFQVVKVDEPDPVRAVAMVRGLARRLEEHHKVRILDEAISEAVSLSARYIAGRQLPDKAIGVLDTACARVAVAQADRPAAVEAAARRMERLTVEIDILRRERVLEDDHAVRLAALEADRKDAEGDLARLTGEWEAERDIVSEMTGLLSKRLEGEPPGPAYAELRDKLKGLQGETAMVPVEVDGDTVASVVAGWTGIPVGRMMRDDIQGVIDLEQRMKQRIVGQDHALDMVARRIRTYRAGLDDPTKPVGVFLFAGPSGVGKTETALTLAELLYGGERNLITINMSEFQEAHTVSSLKGAPPGYVGYGQGGVLTEAVRRNPYSVVLLDEVEKAHPDVMELFFQVFDKGKMEDGEGIEVDFRNTVLILTSNLGDQVILDAAFSDQPTSLDDLIAKVRPQLLTRFKPAFLGRLTVIPYLPLGQDQIAGIVDLKLDRIAKRFAENNGAELILDPTVKEAVVARSGEVESGARAIDSILTQNLLPKLADAVLARMAEDAPFTAARVTLDGSGFVVSFDNG
ncbi:type VI secretion system ATPase TssH [Rhodospirillaceae bacterium KN72]|uniref:Type VI secretion system ATPase TssH n=1 Tax=Pacificispira spongiicola TaxID=2729598 RepID=A0A7Y0HF94_9PROT|nr:type VI secretion system ATPase TssH [Pacificispira spongiicola]NMM44348.1 type VI secretion system ATPase TssH [Pacificispira spongiicola]